MKIQFTVKPVPITLESLTESLAKLYIYSGDESPVDSSKKCFPFYREVLSVLGSDPEYLNDIKIVDVDSVIKIGMETKHNPDDFLPSCGDGNVTRFYAEKHFNELSEFSQEMYRAFEGIEGDEYFFLKPIEDHIELDYGVEAVHVDK